MASDSPISPLSNALGFIPGLGGYFVYSATPDLKFGFSLAPGIAAAMSQLLGSLSRDIALALATSSRR